MSQSVIDDGAVEQPDYETAEDAVLDDQVEDSAVEETDLDGNAGTDSFDWDSDENPYKSRFAGLQASVQREVEQRQQLENELAQLRLQSAYQQINELPEEDRTAALQQFFIAQQLQQRERQLTQREQQNEAIAREAFITQLSQKYGVPRAKLERYSNPDDMEAYAQDVAEERRKARRAREKQQRTSGQADRFEGGTNPARPKPKEPPKHKNLAEAKYGFIEAMLDRR